MHTCLRREPRRESRVTLALLLALALVACGREAREPPQDQVAEGPAALAADVAPERAPASPLDAPRFMRPEAAKAMDSGGAIAGAASRGVAAAPAGSDPGSVTLPRDRKVTRNGSLGLQVTSVDKALDAIRSFTQSAGGYLSNESHAQREFGVRSATITCRLPAERLDDAVATFRKLGKEETLSLQAEDITEEYFNLEIRIRNQRQLEARLLELLSRQSNRLADLLEIEKEVARVRGEIDELEGRKRFWDSQVAFSTLTVSVHEPRPAVASEAGGPWRTLTRAFGVAGDNLVLTVAGIIAATGTLIPLGIGLLVLVMVVRLLWKRYRNRRTRAKDNAAG